MEVYITEEEQCWIELEQVVPTLTGSLKKIIDFKLGAVEDITTEDIVEIFTVLTLGAIVYLNSKLKEPELFLREAFLSFLLTSLSQEVKFVQEQNFPTVGGVQ